MQREIKCRGQRTDDGEWVYGYYCTINGVPHIIQDREPYNQFNRNVAYEVIPETVGQFTGMLGKNYIEIYEGDILHIPCLRTENPFIVEYWTHGYMFRSPTIHSPNTAYTPCYYGDAEIIGNIYDNKELLKTE